MLTVCPKTSLNLTSLTVVTSEANRLFGALEPIICRPYTKTYVPIGVERAVVNQNRRPGMVFDDDGCGQVGRSQSTQNTVRGWRQNACFRQKSDWNIQPNII